MGIKNEGVSPITGKVLYVYTDCRTRVACTGRHLLSRENSEHNLTLHAALAQEKWQS